MAITKTVLIYVLIVYLSIYITPLGILTSSFYVTSTVMYMIVKSIYNDTFNPNKLPGIGFLFIMVDHIILKTCQ
jgi:hypothetical protein